MKSINTSLFDFPTLRDPERGYVYVDKTAQIFEIAKPSADCIYFFPRPRRFGKSLLLSTLKALFQGRRELFKGLAIDKNKAWDWKREVYPVLHLDMSKASCSSVAELEERLSKMMKSQFDLFGLTYDDKSSASGNFITLLDSLPGIAQRSKRGWWSKKPKKGDAPIPGKYVVLIDEYDAPIAGLLDSPKRREALEGFRKALHDFYVVAKANCGDKRFLMVTGVSKFAKTSIFSAFNNPKDLSMDARAADLVGYTHEELETYFHEHIQAFADERGETYDQSFRKLLSWYDSYQFSPKRLVKVVNPVSLGNALSTRTLQGFWEATAGSTLIYDALKSANKAPLDFADAFSVSTLDAPDALEAPTAALLYQGGYLTIDRRINDRMVYLKIPNREVRQSLETGYMSRILGKDFEIDAMQLTAEETAAKLAEEGFTDTFKTMLQSAYSRLPHDWVCKGETEAKRYFLAFMLFANAEVAGEPQHATGRPDAVIRTEKGVYIFEFKYAKSAKAALQQCRERNYAAAYRRVKGEGEGWSSLPPSNNPTIPQSNNPTIQQSNNPTIQKSNNPTIQQSKNPKIQQSNNPTIPLSPSTTSASTIRPARTSERSTTLSASGRDHWTVMIRSRSSVSRITARCRRMRNSTRRGGARLDVQRPSGAVLILSRGWRAYR